MRYIIIVILALLGFDAVGARFSTAGFFAVENSPRTVHSLNPAWLLHRGAVDSALQPESVDFDDREWTAVNLPNSIELLPLDASGGVNYRGEVWYRKHLDMPGELNGKRLILYFEGVMGKSRIYVNGVKVGDHFGGFTPIAIDVTKFVGEGRNLIAVWADNSDDPLYAPGKEQSMLDFCYFGGIYRDVYIVSTSPKMYVSDANMAGKTAGGGVLVACLDASPTSAMLEIKTDVERVERGAMLEYEFVTPEGVVAKRHRLRAVEGQNVSKIELKKPLLWSPDTPNLYEMVVRLRDAKGRITDEFIERVGVRKIEFSHAKGLILNGKAYPHKLIGANRHQDFAVVGNALSNSLHYRDAAKLKACSMDIIRNAHYPQDPAFMDACDELGLFVIVNTPGWQFWNDNPIFEQRIYADIATMIRRDRNHPSVLMWEPILNETWYPDHFALKVKDIVKAEMPYQGSSYTASDAEARGSHNFDIIFTHPKGGDSAAADVADDTTKVYFTREWGDNVDDWNAHNSPSRAARSWGETAQLVQAIHYCAPPYNYTSYDMLCRQAPSHFGGTLWHSFDHQRGYHPDPFYGGVMDAMRRPKYAYYMFAAQASHIAPNVFIANELTPFSPSDITVFSSCRTVRLTTFFGDDSVRVKTLCDGQRWFVFEGAWDFMRDKQLSRNGQQNEVSILAEGLDDKGRVVASHRRTPARRPAKLLLSVDTMSCPLVANGGDMVVVTASVADANGSVKRLNNSYVRFLVEGEGVIVASDETATNPVRVEWGEASILVRTTTRAGKIRVAVAPLFGGDHTLLPAQVEIESRESRQPVIYDARIEGRVERADAGVVRRGQMDVSGERARVEGKLRQVEKQQSDFGGGF